MASVVRLVTLTRSAGRSNSAFALNCTKTQIQNVLIPTRNIASRSRASALRRAVRKSRIASEENVAASCKSGYRLMQIQCPTYSLLSLNRNVVLYCSNYS